MKLGTMSATLASASVAMSLVLSAPAVAADAHGEAVTAATHADLAAKASDLATTQMHLHHALNCLVGPNGNGYDPKSMNPCANSGSGAIADESDPTKKAALEQAAQDARKGLTEADMVTAQKDAMTAASAITAIK